MKELKKFLNKSTNLVYKFLDKIATIIKDEKHSSLIKSIIKLAILILIYFIAGLITEGLIQGGTHIIYYVAQTGRALLSGIWTTVVNFTYFLFIIVSLYQLTEIAEKDNNFFNLYNNKKKDKEVKKKIFLTVESVLKVLGTIILIPLFIGAIGLLFALGIMVGYVKEGIYLISLFTAVIGGILFFTTLIFLVKALLSNIKPNFKKYISLIIASGFIIAISSIGVLFETSSYKVNQNLTTDFTSSKIKYEYKMDSGKDYIFYHNENDKNLELVIDDDLGSYIEVIITHTTTNEVKTSLKNENDKVKISYEEELNLQPGDLEKIFNFGLTCIKEKTIYNYTLLKYAKVEIRVSSDYAEKIKFIDSKGKEYKPYDRINR